MLPGPSDNFSKHARSVIKKAGRCPNCRAQKAAYRTAGYNPSIRDTEEGIPIFIVGCSFLSDGSVHCMVCGHEWGSEATSSSSYVILINSPKSYVVLPESFHSFIRGRYNASPHMWNRRFLDEVDAVTTLHELDYALFQSGDSIIGRLPPHRIAQISAMGCRYFHIRWNEPIDESWLKQHPDEIISSDHYSLKEFIAKEIQHEVPISKCVSLGPVSHL